MAGGDDERGDERVEGLPGGAARVTIRARLDGPLVVDGPVVLQAADGTTETHDRVFLCRCGQSRTKPLCDGTHKRTGFRAPGEAPPTRSG